MKSKLDDADELEDLAALRSQVGPVGEEVDALEKDVDDLLKGKIGQRLEGLEATLWNLAVNAQKKLDEYKKLISLA